VHAMAATLGGVEEPVEVGLERLEDLVEPLVGLVAEPSSVPARVGQERSRLPLGQVLDRRRGGLARGPGPAGVEHPLALAPRLGEQLLALRERSTRVLRLDREAGADPIDDRGDLVALDPRLAGQRYVRSVRETGLELVDQPQDVDSALNRHAYDCRNPTGRRGPFELERQAALRSQASIVTCPGSAATRSSQARTAS
jgi:hypothetical protein